MSDKQTEKPHIKRARFIGKTVAWHGWSCEGGQVSCYSNSVPGAYQGWLKTVKEMT